MAFSICDTIYRFLDTMEPRPENTNSCLKNCFDNLDLKGVNFCVTQFATRFTHVSRQYQTKNRKNIESLEEKNILQL